jgi:LmbE family N-acetylglucosaminyl deacetylase
MLHIVSPHIDDAIFSIGGLISKLARRNEEISIHYVFTLSEWTNPEASSNPVHNSGVETVTAERKKEERSISSIVSYGINFFDFLDFPLRPKTDASEIDMIKSIASRIRRIVDRHEVVFFPVGITHPDHVIVGIIGRTLFDEGYNVMFYEDLPYAARATANHEYAQWLLAHQFESQLERISIESKINLMNLYRSQTSEEWIRHVREYSYSFNPVDHNSYERFWRRRKSVIF